MDDYCCKIERLINGYEVELKDPEIVKANRRPSKGMYRDPCKSFVFTTIEDVLAFLKVNLDKALPDDDYGSSFKMASVEEDDDE